MAKVIADEMAPGDGRRLPVNGPGPGPGPDAERSALAHAAALGVEPLAQIVAGTEAGITVTDPDGRYVYANPAACRMLGHPLEQLRGRRLFDSFPEREQANVRAHLSHQIDEGGALFTCIVLGADGTEREIVYSAYAVEIDRTRHGVGILRDLSGPRAAARTAMALAQRTAQQAGAATLDETMSAIARHGVEGTRALAAGILVMDEADNVVSGGGHGSGGPDFGKAELGWKAMAGSPGAPVIAAMTLGSIAVDAAPGEPVVVPDARSGWEADPIMHAFAASLAEERWRGAVFVPLSWEGRVLGVLGVYLPARISGPNEAELAFYTALADQAAVAVTSARLKSQASRAGSLLERARLARDLHDSVSQALFSMTMHARAAQLSMAKAGLEDDGPVGRSLAQLTELTSGALAEMRALIFELRPGALAEEGLVAAVRKQAAALTAREQVAITVQAGAERLALAADTEEHVYRILLEALHNVIKHARAATATVLISSDAAGLEAAVRDDGVGFTTGAEHAGHLGLLTMAERAGVIGARLTVTSAPKGGTTVLLSLPYDTTESSDAR